MSCASLFGVCAAVASCMIIDPAAAENPALNKAEGSTIAGECFEDMLGIQLEYKSSSFAETAMEIPAVHITLKKTLDYTPYGLNNKNFEGSSVATQSTITVMSEDLSQANTSESNDLSADLPVTRRDRIGVSIGSPSVTGVSAPASHMNVSENRITNAKSPFYEQHNSPHCGNEGSRPIIYNPSKRGRWYRRGTGNTSKQKPFIFDRSNVTRKNRGMRKSTHGRIRSAPENIVKSPYVRTRWIQALRNRRGSKAYGSYLNASRTDLPPRRNFLTHALLSSLETKKDYNAIDTKVKEATASISNQGEVTTRKGSDVRKEPFDTECHSKDDFIWAVKHRVEQLRGDSGEKTARERVEEQWDHPIYKINQENLSQCSSKGSSSSCDSIRGIVNKRNTRSNINMCENLSDMWYGLKTQDGKPVVMRPQEDLRRSQRSYNEFVPSHHTHPLRKFHKTGTIMDKRNVKEHKRPYHKVTREGHAHENHVEAQRATAFTFNSRKCARRRNMRARDKRYFAISGSHKNDDCISGMNIQEKGLSGMQLSKYRRPPPSRLVYYDSTCDSNSNKRYKGAQVSEAAAIGRQGCVETQTPESFCRLHSVKAWSAEKALVQGSFVTSEKGCLNSFPLNESSIPASSISRAFNSSRCIYMNTQTFRREGRKKTTKVRRKKPKHLLPTPSGVSASIDSKRGVSWRFGNPHEEIYSLQEDSPENALENHGTSSLRPLISYDDLECRSIHDVSSARIAPTNGEEATNFESKIEERNGLSSINSYRRQHVQRLLASSRELDTPEEKYT